MLKVLLVDDLADSGVTLKAVVDRLRGIPSIHIAPVNANIPISAASSPGRLNRIGLEEPMFRVAMRKRV